MKLSAPKFVVWLIALIVGLLAVLAGIGVLTIPIITPHAFWILTGSWALLILATFLKGL